MEKLIWISCYLYCISVKCFFKKQKNCRTGLLFSKSRRPVLVKEVRNKKSNRFSEKQMEGRSFLMKFLDYVITVNAILYSKNNEHLLENFLKQGMMEFNCRRIKKITGNWKSIGSDSDHACWWHKLTLEVSYLGICVVKLSIRIIVRSNKRGNPLDLNFAHGGW